MSEQGEGKKVFQEDEKSRQIEMYARRILALILAGLQEGDSRDKIKESVGAELEDLFDTLDLPR